MSIPNYYPQAQYTATSYASSPLYSFNTTSGFSTGLGIPAAAQQPTRPPAGPVVRPSSPVQAAVNSKVASQVIQRLAAGELKEAGFSGAQAEALYVLEMEVVNFVQSLYQRAHEYANLANRSGPIATDLLLATEEFDKEYDVSPEKLGKWLRKRERKVKKRRGKPFVQAPSLVPPSSRSPSPELLPSDDEDEDMVDVNANLNPAPAPQLQHLQLHPVPPPPPKPVKYPGAAHTLRSLPSTFPQFPGLPPKHTYLQTPAPTTRTTTSTLPTLSKKLATATLVQESLRNLLLATEDAESGPGREDAELLGYIVNWEASGTGRKRWRV